MRLRRGAKPLSLSLTITKNFANATQPTVFVVINSMTTFPDLLDRFARFLNASWATMEPAFEADKTRSLQIDWLQANWELIVEGGLLPHRVTLRPYGDGADCNGTSSRVLFPERAGTHRIVLEANQGSTLFDYLGQSQIDTTHKAVVFDRLVSLGTDGWYYECPPFTHIIAENDGAWVLIARGNVVAMLEPTQ